MSRRQTCATRKRSTSANCRKPSARRDSVRSSSPRRAVAAAAFSATEAAHTRVCPGRATGSGTGYTGGTCAAPDRGRARSEAGLTAVRRPGRPW